MKRRVVITGLGPAAAIGIGREAFFSGILAQKTCLARIPAGYEKNYTFKSRWFVPAPVFSLSAMGLHKATEAMMEEASRLAVLCARLALADAGLPLGDRGNYWQAEGLENCGIILGIGMSSLQTALESYAAHRLEPEEVFLGDKAQAGQVKPRFHRMVIPMLMTNSPAAWISILFGIKGPAYTINASCASGTYALGEAYHSILEGRSDVVLTGGVEALGEKSGAIMRGFDMLSTLTRAEDGLPRPFSRERSGFLFNAGAGCILVLEEVARAQKRGADIYAEIVGCESCSDAFSIARMEPSGDSIRSLFLKATKDIRVDYLNAHGTATEANDEIEAGVIRQVFGKRSSQPYINSSKGILGHSIGASGALEAAITAMAVKESKIHGNLTREPLDDLNLPLESITAPIEYGLTASYGFGGHNALLLLKRYER